MTAEAIRDAYPCPDAGPSSTAIPPVIEIVQLGELREKQFRQRSLEGLESTAVAAARHGEEEEPFEEVSARAKRFLDAVLLPLLEDLLLSSTRQCVFIVAHGGIHSYVWLQFVRVLRTTLRVPPLSTPGVMRLESVPLDEFLSNAAYHEVILKTEEILPEPPFSVQPTASYIGRALSVAHVTFAAINSVDHLSGLKKTGGGIGNSKFDKKQRKIDSFFSPRKRKPDSPGEGSTKCSVFFFCIPPHL